MLSRFMVGALVFVLFFEASAEESVTLNKISSSGVISLGYRANSIPFSYANDRQEIFGYSYEIMYEIAEEIMDQIGKKHVDVKLKLITPMNRFSLIQDGSIDIECSSTTNNTARQKLVTFSNTIFVSETKVLTKRDSGIKDFDDLRGKNVITISNSVAERKLKLLAGVGNVSTHNFIDEKPIQALEQGLVDAYVMDDVILFNSMAKFSRRPEELVVVGTPIHKEAYACTLPRGDFPFKKMVDGVIYRIMKSGQAKRIYEKWFMHPIPPLGQTLNMPITSEMMQLFDSPNDRAFE